MNAGIVSAIVIVVLLIVGWFAHKLWQDKVTAEKMGKTRDEARDIADRVREMSDEELDAALRGDHKP